MVGERSIGDPGLVPRKGACMRLFRRKPTMDIDDLPCPRCTERVPEGATECDMCGLDLRPLRSGATTARTNEVRDRG
jgi:hypothetical protein